MSEIDEKSLIKAKDSFFYKFVKWIKNLKIFSKDNTTLVDDQNLEREYILKDMELLERIIKREIEIDDISNGSKIRLIKLCEDRIKVLEQRIEDEKSKINNLLELKD